MTGALPETRLILLAWISNFSVEPIPASDARISSILNVTLKQFRLSIDYLVEEGYLLKVRNLDGGFPSRQRAIKFSYMLIPECFREWSKALDNIKNVHEFQYVFRSRLEEDSNRQFKKQKRLKASERLVLAMLIAYSDLARYVKVFDESSISIMVGMSIENLRSTIFALSQKGYISILSMGAASGKLFGHLNRIYKVHPINQEFKLVKVGLIQPEAFPSILFLSKLDNFYQRAIKSKSLKRFPKHTEYLPTEHYLELSKSLQNKDIFKSIYQLCHAEIFTIIPNHVYELTVNDDSKDKQKDSQLPPENKLEEFIRTQLSEGLFSGKCLADNTDNRYFESLEPGSAESIPFLRIYVLEFLTLELTNLVKVLSNQLKPFYKKYGKSFQIMGYSLNLEMVGLRQLSEQPIVETESLSPEAENIEECDLEAKNQNVKTALTERLTTNFIMNLLVPNLDHFNDSLVFNDEVIPTHSIVDSNHKTKGYKLIKESKESSAVYSKRAK